MIKYAKKNQRLELGRCGENLATTWAFDISAWITEFGGSGTVVLLHQRSGDDAPYPVAITVEDGTVLWAVTSADVASPGAGQAELQYLTDDVVVKSAIWSTRVLRSLDEPGDAPAPESGWVAELLEEVRNTASGLSADIKTALLACFEHVAWIDEDGQTYYDALEDALYPPVTVRSITAAYAPGSHLVYEGDALSSLIPYLTVTARYSDYTTGTVASTDYTLSGTLTAGTSVVTVSYEGITTTVNVVVQPPVGLSSISAVFTQGDNVIYDTDSLDTLKQYLVVTAHYSDNTTETVADTDYTLSGTLEEGTSTITVSYGGKTATFSVTVTIGISLTIIRGAPNISNGGELSYNGTESKRACHSPFAVKLPVGRYAIGLGAYNGTTDYYYGVAMIGSSVLDDVTDWDVSFGTSRTFISSPSDITVYRNDTNGTGGWHNDQAYYDVTSSNPYLIINFKKGTAGTANITKSDITNIATQFTIERVAL